MRRVLLAASTLAGVMIAAPAHAQWIVSDPPTELNTLFTYVEAVEQVLNSAKQIEQGVEEIKQLTNTVNAIVHGNVYQVGSLAAELSGQPLMNPVTNLSAEINQMFTGATLGSGAVGALAGQILGQTQLYAPPGQDYRAMMIQAHAISAATQMAAAGVMYDGTQGRIGALPQLGTAIGNSVDIKDAMDANARLAHEQLVQSAHANQLATLVMLQAGQREVRQAQEEQAWRCSADSFVAEAAAAAQAAGAGAVTLVSGAGAVPCATATAGTISGTGSGAPGGDGATGGTGGGGEVIDPTGGSTGGSGGVTTAALGSSSSAGSDPLNTMLAQSWGTQASSNAQALGVNPAALAATCSIESNCRNVGGQGSVSGPFQMTDRTYRGAINAATAANPALGDQVVGKSDPATESIAASQELKNAATGLQNAGIANPTVLDTRGYYQFGAGNGVSLATASGSAPLSSVLVGTSAATLAANGLSPTTTIGQWRSSVTSKLGSAANQPVLLASSI